MSQALRDLFGEEQVRTDEESLTHYGKDWTNGFLVAPSAVVFPESNDQVVDLVRYAIEQNVPLVPSGGRTGLSGGAIAGQGEVVVSFERMNKILDFSVEDRLVTCQAGVITQTLQEFAVAQGLFYPVDFASAGSSQIGGNVSTNAGGLRLLRYYYVTQLQNRASRLLFFVFFDVPDSAYKTVVISGPQVRQPARHRARARPTPRASIL